MRRDRELMFGSTMPPRTRSSCPQLIRASFNPQKRIAKEMDCRASASGSDAVLRTAMPRNDEIRKRRLLPPHLTRDFHCEPQFRPLLFLGEDVALFGGSKAALRRYRELIQGGVSGGVLQPPCDVVLFLELAALGGDDAGHHELVALWQKPQRLQTAGTLASRLQGMTRGR